MLLGEVQYANNIFGAESIYRPGSDRALTRKKRDKNIHGRVKWEGGIRGLIGVVLRGSMGRLGFSLRPTTF